jgi:hypothetical protein
MGPGTDDDKEPAKSAEASSAAIQRPLPPKTIQVTVNYSLSGSGPSANTPIKEYTSKITFKRPRYNHVLARANALRKHGHLLLVGGLKQQWVGAALEKETVRDFMTPDFWKANLFLTNNTGGGENDTLKANVAELKSLLTNGGDGSSRIKMYASPRLIA